jgi:DNA anti-recombination protein RmuC
VKNSQWWAPAVALLVLSGCDQNPIEALKEPPTYPEWDKQEQQDWPPPAQVDPEQLRALRDKVVETASGVSEKASELFNDLRESSSDSLDESSEAASNSYESMKAATADTLRATADKLESEPADARE